MRTNPSHLPSVSGSADDRSGLPEATVRDPEAHADEG